MEIDQIGIYIHRVQLVCIRVESGGNLKTPVSSGKKGCGEHDYLLRIKI